MTLARRALSDRAALVASTPSATSSERPPGSARVNALASVVLRSSLPGVPDCYQGDEAWNLSLVDPDNRRPVDYPRLARALERLAGPGAPAPAELRRAWPDGPVKLLVTSRCLLARRAAPGALAPGATELGLRADGPAAGSVLGLARAGTDGTVVVAVVTRLGSRLEAPPGDLPAGPSYAGTVLELADPAPRRFSEALTGREVLAEEGRLHLEEVLAELPVALLVGRDGPPAGS